MHRPIVIALGLATLAAGSAHAGASDSRALRLLSECKAATGGAALDRPEAFRETGTITMDGQPSTYETFGDLHALRSESKRTIDGQPHRAGFDGAAPWHLNAAGQVERQTDAPTVAGERMGTYLTVSGYLYPERFPASFRYLGRRRTGSRRFDVVEATPADATPVQLWLDARTHRLTHVEATSGGEILTGDLSDYRVVDGTWVAYALDLKQGGQNVSLRLASFTYIPLADAPIAPPAAPG